MFGLSQPAESRAEILEDENGLSVTRYGKSGDSIRLTPCVGYGDITVSAFNHGAIVELGGNIVLPGSRQKVQETEGMGTGIERCIKVRCSHSENPGDSRNDVMGHDSGKGWGNHSCLAGSR